MFTDGRDIKSSDEWKQNEMILSDKDELQQTSNLLKKIRDNLSNSPSAFERQQSFNVVLDIVNRLSQRVQQIQQRTTTTTSKPVLVEGL